MTRAYADPSLEFQYLWVIFATFLLCIFWSYCGVKLLLYRVHSHVNTHTHTAEIHFDSVTNAELNSVVIIPRNLFGRIVHATADR